MARKTYKQASGLDAKRARDLHGCLSRQAAIAAVHAEAGRAEETD